MDLVTFFSGIGGAILTQAIKAADPENKYKQWYSPIALTVCFLAGAGVSYATNADWGKAVQTGVAVATATYSAVGLKDMVGIKVPGDSTYQAPGK